MAKIQQLQYEAFGPYRVIGTSFRTKPMSPDIQQAWGRFFEGGGYQKLEALAANPQYQTPLPDAYAGLINDGREDDSFVYTVGLIFAADTPVPAGFDHIDLPAGTIANAWVQGHEGEVYAQCLPLISARAEADGYKVKWNGFWSCEVYTMERFEKAKKEGKEEIVLDYYLTVEKA